MNFRGLLLILSYLVFHGIAMGQDDIQSIGELPANISETSGLILIGEHLVTHNDSGNSPELYVLDTTHLNIVRTVQIDNALNTDWEDLAQDDDFIYIGDFGNNAGDRQDLAVLRISKNDFLGNDTVGAERINFTYEDQTDFTTVEQTDWDAEALIVLNDSLVILTKQWISNGTVAYGLPKEPGDHVAERLDEYRVNGLVTGADYDSSSNTLYLSGYFNLLIPFFAVADNVSASAIFQGTKTKSNLNVGFAQIESITRTFDGTFYCTSEEFNASTPPIASASRLFRFTENLENVENEEDMEPDEPEEETPEDELIVYKQFGSNQLNYNLNTEEPIFGVGIFDVNGKRVWFRPLEFETSNTIDISGLSPSIYFIGFQLRDGFLSKAFVKD